MPDSIKTLIMKFGGSVLHNPDSFRSVARWVVQNKNEYRLVVVVSAMQGETDRLAALAYQIHPSPPRREYDMLVSVGERVSMALLAMALEAAGCHAISFTGSQSGVMTTSEHTDAQIIEVHPYRIQAALNEGKVAIIAGFQGISREKEITTLGRGGSDITAVALGVALGSEVEFYKDVPGIYEEDPKICPSVEPPCPYLSYEEAFELVHRTGGRVIHPRALQLAAENQVVLRVRSFFSLHDRGTIIGPIHHVSKVASCQRLSPQGDELVTNGKDPLLPSAY